MTDVEAIQEQIINALNEKVELLKQHINILKREIELLKKNTMKTEGMWKPKLKEVYYFADITEKQLYMSSYWEEDETDKHRLSHGLVFKTEAKAITKAKEILSKL